MFNDIHLSVESRNPQRVQNLLILCTIILIIKKYTEQKSTMCTIILIVSVEKEEHNLFYFIFINATQHYQYYWYCFHHIHKH